MTSVSTSSPTAPAVAPPALEAENVSLSFGGLKAVSDFSLSLRPGALHGLIGPNGAGKTTVFNLLTGIYQPDAGAIRIDGKPTRRLKPHQIVKRGMARTFQNIRLFGDLTVFDNVRIGCQARASSGILSTFLRTPRQIGIERAIERRVDELLELLDLSAFRDEFSRNLPYGHQRRLEIARALATEPRVLLLDEPAAGMNPQEKRTLSELIRSIRDRFSLTVLLIEHDMSLVMGVCEELTVLEYGQVIARGTPAEIQKNPKVIEAYLGVPDDSSATPADPSAPVAGK